ncbi:MAG: DUF1127 domain-containing protein [Pseudomonadota bacterium]
MAYTFATTRSDRFAPRSASIVALAKLLMRWTEVAAQRRALKRLDHERLADIGVTREEADAEANRSFWSVSRAS